MKNFVFTRRIESVLCGFFLFFSVFGGTPHFAEAQQQITVTTTADTVDASDGVVSLREAVTIANTRLGADVITFAPNVTGTVPLTGGQFNLSDDITISGPGSRVLALSGNNASRHFFINRNALVTISGLMMRDGLEQVADNASAIAGEGEGGSIYNTGTLTLINCSFQNNRVIARVGKRPPEGDLNGRESRGGAISSYEVLAVRGCTFTANRCVGGNGVQGESGPGSGGRAKGGAIYVEGLKGSTIFNSTFWNNEAQGGEGPFGQGFGGALSNGPGALDITHCTITENRAVPNGMCGGFDGSARINSSIIANNIARFDPDLVSLNGNYNLIKSPQRELAGANNKTGIDPELGPLTNNGGSTDTMLPNPNSPVIDAAIANGLPTDQRNISRPFQNPSITNAPTSDGSDIGAVESQAISLGTAAPLAVADTVATNENISVRVNVLNNDLDEDTPNMALRVKADSLADIKGGTVALSEDARSVVFIPTSGADNRNTPNGFGFSYVATDGQNDSNRVTVQISVVPENEAPVVNFLSSYLPTAYVDGSFTITAYGTDPDSDSLIYKFIVRRPNGTVLVNAQNASGTLIVDLNKISGEIVGELLTTEVVVSDGKLTSAPKTVTTKIIETPSIVVTTTADVVDNGDNLTSLREAITAARVISPFDTITFANHVRGTIALNSEISIQKGLTILGPGARELALSGRGRVRHFTISAFASDVTISGLTLRDGAALTSATNVGGSILNQSTLTLKDCALVNNRAIGTKPSPVIFADPISYGRGGAIYNMESLALVNCTLSGNLAQGGEQGDNGKTGESGGIGEGGAIYSGSDIYGVATPNCVLSLTNCTLSGNTALGRQSNGPSTPDGAGRGGAIATNSGNVILTHVTIANNMAQRGGARGNSEGGGVWAHNASFSMYSSLIASNVAVGGNTTAPDVAGQATGNYNLVGNAIGVTLQGSNNKINSDAKLGALANNGGPTDTHALIWGSPAIDAAESKGQALDQRGHKRPEDDSNIANALGGDGSDIGAFEADVPSLSDISKTLDEDGVASFSQSDFTNAIETNNTGVTFSKIRIVSLPSQGTLSLGTSTINRNQEIVIAQLDSLLYTPQSDYNGSDSFSFVATDGTSYDTSSAHVILTIKPVNDVPTAQAQELTGVIGQNISFILEGNDVDGDALTYEGLSFSGDGTLGGGRLSGTAPNLSFVTSTPGTYTLQFRVRDGAGAVSDTATVTIIIGAVSGQSVTGLITSSEPNASYSASLIVPLPNARVQLEFSGRVLATTVTDGVGRYTFYGQSLVNGTYTVHVTAIDTNGTGSPTTLPFVLTQPLKVTIPKKGPAPTQFTVPPFTLYSLYGKVSVKSADKKIKTTMPVPGANVQLSKTNSVAYPAFTRSTTSNGNGFFVFKYLGRASFNILATAPGVSFKSTKVNLPGTKKPFAPSAHLDIVGTPVTKANSTRVSSVHVS